MSDINKMYCYFKSSGPKKYFNISIPYIALYKDAQ